MVCTFFGHSNTPTSVYLQLYSQIENLILNRGVTQFFVGNHGTFDSMALKALRALKNNYPHITYRVVLSYVPTQKPEHTLYHYSETILPEGIETVPKRFAISWRNKWMVQQSDIVIGYITHSWGGAAQFVKYAKNRGKEIINLTLL